MCFQDISTNPNLVWSLASAFSIMVSLYSSDWLGTHWVAQASPDHPVSAGIAGRCVSAHMASAGVLTTAPEF